MLGSDLVDDDFEPRTVPERSAGNAEIPGSLVETDLGPYWLRISEFPLSHLHGAYRLEDGLKAASKRIYSLTGDEALRDFSSDRAFFVDTETTSLAGGAGVTVFMTGIGYYHENRFRVEQYFMRDFAVSFLVRFLVQLLFLAVLQQPVLSALTFLFQFLGQVLQFFLARFAQKLFR